MAEIFQTWGGKRRMFELLSEPEKHKHEEPSWTHCSQTVGNGRGRSGKRQRKMTRDVRENDLVTVCTGPALTSWMVAAQPLWAAAFSRRWRQNSAKNNRQARLSYHVKIALKTEATCTENEKIPEDSFPRGCGARKAQMAHGGLRGTTWIRMAVPPITTGKQYER